MVAFFAALSRAVSSDMGKKKKKNGCVHLYVFVCARTQRLAAVVDGDGDDERELLSMAERRTQSWSDRTSREP